jgi:lipid II:glycine glycyltransferase (peptidoglycan interpeptide bridge formation enzyme)
LQSGVPGEEWDGLQRRLGAHFLQSRAWAEFQAALGRAVVHASGDEWSLLGVHQSNRAVRYAYLPYGPTFAGSALPEAIDAVREHAKADRLDFVRLEPLGPMAGEVPLTTGARQVEDVQPRHTWVLDITQDPDALRRGLASGHRSGLNSAPRKGVVCRSSAYPGDVESFLDLLHVTARHGAFRPHPDDYYRTLLSVLAPQGCAALHFAEHEGRAVAGSIGFDFEGTRFYAHAATDQEGSRKTGAAVALVWHMIETARDAGFTNFDFWGVAPTDDPRHPWSGLTYFKKSFGGSLVSRAGTWDIPLRHFKYRLYRSARRLLRMQ